MAVGGSKVQRRRALSARATAGAFGLEAWSVDVGAVEYKHANTLLAAAGAGSMQRQNAIEVAVGRLAVLQGEFDQADIARSSGIVQSQIGMHPIGMARGAAEAALAHRFERGATNGTTQHLCGDLTTRPNSTLWARVQIRIGAHWPEKVLVGRNHC